MPIKRWRGAVLPDTIGFGRDVRHGAGVLDPPTHGIAVMTLVGVQDFAGREALQEGRSRRSHCAISNVATRQHEHDGTAILIGQGVDFGRAATVRATYGWLSPPSTTRGRAVGLVCRTINQHLNGWSFGTGER